MQKSIGFDDSFIYDELELKPENQKSFLLKLCYAKKLLKHSKHGVLKQTR